MKTHRGARRRRRFRRGRRAPARLITEMSSGKLGEYGDAAKGGKRARDAHRREGAAEIVPVAGDGDDDLHGVEDAGI